MMQLDANPESKQDRDPRSMTQTIEDTYAILTSTSKRIGMLRRFARVREKDLKIMRERIGTALAENGADIKRSLLEEVFARLEVDVENAELLADSMEDHEHVTVVLLKQIETIVPDALQMINRVPSQLQH